MAGSSTWSPAAARRTPLRRRCRTSNRARSPTASLGEDFGRILDPHGGRADLEIRTIRVLHERSFVDDPTRIFRAVRYEARLGFPMDQQTEGLAREGVGGIG